MHAHKLKIHRDLLKSDNRAKTTTRASFDSRYTFLEDDAEQEEEETSNTKPPQGTKKPIFRIMEHDCFAHFHSQSYDTTVQANTMIGPCCRN